MRPWLLLAGFLALGSAGCVLPLSEEAAARMIEQLAKDEASACLAMSVMVGGGALIPAPAVPLMGGSAWLYIGRSNAPGSRVTINGSGCEIEHGLAVP